MDDPLNSFLEQEPRNRVSRTKRQRTVVFIVTLSATTPPETWITGKIIEEECRPSAPG
jgi:hypothetical protein